MFRTCGINEEDENGATTARTWVLAEDEDPCTAMTTREPDEVGLFPPVPADAPELPYISLTGR
jgi:hypothetical protein